MKYLYTVTLLLAATQFEVKECTFSDLGYLDLVHPIDLWSRYKPGFKVTSVWKPQGCGQPGNPLSKPGDFMHQDYKGTLKNGVVFDTSAQRNKTFNFFLGLGYVIDGVDIGMTGMCKGEMREIVVPPSLGYGNRAVGSIPPNSELIFDVILREKWVNPFRFDTIFQPANCNRKTHPGDKIRIHYNGTLEQDGTSFWRTYDQGPSGTLNFTLGEGNVIKALDYGLLDMCVGETRTIFAHNLLAYGDRGRGTTIPPKADLIFDVELVEITTGSMKFVKIDGPDCSRNLGVFNNDQLTIEYSGLTSSGQILSSGLGNATFKVGSPQSFLGLDYGVNLMCVGERRRLLIPPEFMTADFDNAGFPVGERLTLDIKLLSNNFGKPATATPTSAPTTRTPSTTMQRPSPTTRIPAPTTQPPAPTTQPPAPTTQPPAPTTGAPAPTTRASAPTTQPPAPTTRAPAPTTQPPAPTTQPPAPTTQPPAPTTQPPAPTTQPPAPTTRAPAPTTKPPAPTTQPPAPTTQPPAPTTRASAPTTQPPAPTTQPPAPTTQPPAPTTQPPVPTTQPPAPTTQPPVPTTQPPASSSITCVGVNPYVGPAFDRWCQSVCDQPLPYKYCPATHCRCV